MTTYGLTSVKRWMNFNLNINNINNMEIITMGAVFVMGVVLGMYISSQLEDDIDRRTKK